MPANTIRRRTFLAFMGSVPLWALADKLTPRSAAQGSDREKWWPPNSASFPLGEWRYIVGRIVNGDQDYGFISCLIDGRGLGLQELLVERQEFTGKQRFVGATYPGKITYDPTSISYIFTNEQGMILSNWTWDTHAQVYRLTIATPELSLSDVILTPQGDVIAEGVNGVVNGGTLGSIPLKYGYHADWTAITVNGVPQGIARVDMEGVLLSLNEVVGTTPVVQDDDHHWFVLAGELSGEPVWITASLGETSNGQFWGVTIATGSGASWQVTSVTEAQAIADPLEVHVLELQVIPEAGDIAQPKARTGTRWRIAAGLVQAGDLIDVELAVPPGQFVSDERQGLLGGASKAEEGVGYEAHGTIMGRSLTNVFLVAAETSVETYLQWLPIVRKR